MQPDLEPGESGDGVGRVPLLHEESVLHAVVKVFGTSAHERIDCEHQFEPMGPKRRNSCQIGANFSLPCFLSLSLSFIFSLDRSLSGLQVWKGLWIELEVAHRFLPVVVEQQVAHVLGGLLGHDLLDVLGQPRVGKVGEGWDLNMLAGYGEFEQRIEKRVI